MEAFVWRSKQPPRRMQEITCARLAMLLAAPSASPESQSKVAQLVCLLLMQLFLIPPGRPQELDFDMLSCLLVYFSLLFTQKKDSKLFLLRPWSQSSPRLSEDWTTCSSSKNLKTSLSQRVSGLSDVRVPVHPQQEKQHLSVDKHFHQFTPTLLQNM